MSRPLLYVAYPMRLDMGAANAIQTYHTVRELKRLIPEMRLVVPRWLLEKSAFSQIGAMHLPRPAVNKLSKFIPWAGWSYIERTLFAWMLVVLMMLWRMMGRGYRVVYVRDAVCAAWLGLGRSFHGACVIYEVHDLEASHPSKAGRWPRLFWSRALPWLDHVALRRANEIVSLTDTFRQWLAQSHMRDISHVAVIPDAFDPSPALGQSKTDARAKLGLSPSPFIVGYAGLTFAYRRLDLLVAAFALLLERVDDCLLVLVGGRPHEVDELRALARKLGIKDDKLVMPGQVEHAETGVYMVASDVLVIPDTVTGMTASPLKLFEYMAAGKAIVCKDMPALREIVDETCALFFPEGDVETLSDVLYQLYRSPDLSERLGAQAALRSVGYTYHARAESILKVVQDCQ